MAMNPFTATFRGVTKAADATTAAAGAIGGAAINGAVGAVRGAAGGIRSGLSSGSQSPAAAALTIGAIGAAGLVEWPLLVAVGGTALVVHQLSRRTDGNAPAPAEAAAAGPTLSSVPTAAEPAPRKTTSRATTSTRKPASGARKSTAARRSSTTK